MSIRQMYPGSIVKPGFNPLGSQTLTPQSATIFTWGRGSEGQSGLNVATARSSPVQIGSLSNWATVSSGLFNSAAITTDGKLYMWGYNEFGAIGNNNPLIYPSSPVQVGALTNWSKVVAAGYHTIALKTNGTLWSWGYSASGQLGLSNTTYYSSPKQVGSLTDWLQISGGQYTNGAVKTDGSLWMWGRNQNGQQGISSATDPITSPRQVTSSYDWASIDIGSQGNTAVAIKTNGTLWAWGLNTVGQVGDGTTTTRQSPVQIGALTNWARAVMGASGCVAVKTDGTLWVWGGSYIDAVTVSSPVQVGTLTNWLYVAGGRYSGYGAIKTDGTLWTWGAGNQGQLGHSDTVARSSPTQVGSDTYWGSISIGHQAMLAG